jgi:hypothetical protein
MPTTITSAGVTFNDTTTLTSATLVANSVGTTQITNGSVTAAKLGTTEQKQIAKAWVNFNGTTSPGTIRSSFNVSSVTKNGTGDYTVNFTTAMADANYSIVLGGSRNNSAVDNFGMQFYSQATGSVRINTIANNSGYVDSPYACVSIFGN